LSDFQPIAASVPREAPARAAIARAANRTGVDFDYLLAQARIESSLNPNARAGTSSAAGLYQFTRGTWLNTLDKHGAEHGLGWAGSAIEGGRVRDPAMRAQIMALRFDPEASSAMAAELASDNAAALTPMLGRAPDAAELYLAHFLGVGGASQFLSALQSDPGQSAAAILPKAAAANRGIFYDRGAPRSVGAVMDLLRGKVAGAMDGSTGAGIYGAPGGIAPDFADLSAPADPADPASGIAGWGPQAWAAASANAQNPGQFPGAPAASDHPRMAGAAPAARPSMADTLRDTFGLASPDGHSSAPGFVRAAYGNLRSLGL
jgi:hypothetical protein